MSFLGGPECSTASNPLAQFQKQTSADSSLQRDRLTSRQPQQLNGFRSHSNGPQDAAFQDFARQGPQFAEALPNDALRLEQTRQQQRVGGGGGGGGVGAGGAWAGEFAHSGPTFSPEEFAAAKRNASPAGFNPHEFAKFRQNQWTPSPVPGAESPVYQQSAFQRGPMYSSGFTGGGFGMQQPMMHQSPFMNQSQQGYEGKGKGRIQELSDTDWEQQFAALTTEDKEAELEKLDREAEGAIERELNQIDRSDEPTLEEFETIWKRIRETTNATRDMLGEDEETKNRFGEDFDHWKEFDGLGHEFDGLRTHDWNHGPDLGDYMFEENNPFVDTPNAFEEGQKIMREGGSLSLAALAFEAAVRKQSDFVDAWVALGQAQAQNEKESPAIRALERAIKLDPNNLDALMGLAVSYTNEGYDSLAYRTLERWVGVKYPQLGVQPRGINEMEDDMGFTDRHILHERVTNLFLEAAQMNPEGGNVDVDVQVGLGVLFYGSEDYDKAVDCFTAALNSVEHGALKKEGEEHLLWNRLGATLANSGRSEEAIEAYSRALELRSNFVRARYNLGVSCINLGVHEEAAAHLLGALNMHRVIEQEGRQKAAELLRDGNGNAVDDATVENLLQQNQSTNLYDTLRRVFSQMGRRDLAEMVGPDMDLDRFRGEFEF